MQFLELELIENYQAIVKYALEEFEKHNINPKKIMPLLKDNDRILKEIEEKGLKQ